MTTRRRIATNILFLGGGQSLSWLFAAINILIIPRYLGPAGIGLLALMAAISSIIAITASFGTKLYITREVARDPLAAQTLVAPAILLSVCAALVGWLVALAIILWSGASDTFKLVAYISTVSSTFGIFVIPMQSALQGMDKMRYSLYETLVIKGLGTALAVTLAYLQFGVALVAATDLVVTFLVLLLNLYWFRRHSALRFALQRAVFVRLVRSGFSFLVNDVTFNIYLYLDGILLTAFTDTQTVGYYSVPTRLFGTLLVLPVLISKAILPSLARLAVGAQDAMEDMGRKTLNFLICMSLPVAVGTTVIAEPFIRFFYGPAYAPSVPIMVILGWSVLPTYLGIGLFQILVAQDKQRGWTKLMLLACFVNLGLNVILIPLFQKQNGNGGIGAAIALLLTETTIGVFGCLSVGRGVVNARLAGDALKSLVVAALMGVAIWPLRDLFLPIPVLVGSIVYAIGVVIVGLVPFSLVRGAFGVATRWRRTRVSVR